MLFIEKIKKPLITKYIKVIIQIKTTQNVSMIVQMIRKKHYFSMLFITIYVVYI